MLATLAGIALDALTLTTCAILATIAIIGTANPTMDTAAVMPIMLTVFAVCVTSGTAKIALNRHTRKTRP